MKGSELVCLSAFATLCIDGHLVHHSLLAEQMTGGKHRDVGDGEQENKGDDFEYEHLAKEKATYLKAD